MARTVRVALWGGEEEGVYGSTAYVQQHFAQRATMVPPRPLDMVVFTRGHSGRAVERDSFAPFRPVARLNDAVVLRRETWSAVAAVVGPQQERVSPKGPS